MRAPWLVYIYRRVVFNWAGVGLGHDLFFEGVKSFFSFFWIF